MYRMRICVLVIACVLLSVTLGAIASIEMSQRASSLFNTDGGEFKIALALVKATKEGKAAWDRLDAPSSPLKIVIDTATPSTDPWLTTGGYAYYDPTYDLDALPTGGKGVIDSADTGGIAELASTIFWLLRYAELNYECDIQYETCWDCAFSAEGVTETERDILADECFEENIFCVDSAWEALYLSLQGKTGDDDDYDSKMEKFLNELVKKCQSETFRGSFHTILAFSKVERGGQVLGATNNTLTLKEHDNGSCKQITLEPGDRIQFTIWGVPRYECHLFFSPMLPDPEDSASADECEGVLMGLGSVATKTTDTPIWLENNGSHTVWFTIPTLDYPPEKHYYLQVCAYNPEYLQTDDGHTVLSHVLDIHVP